MEIVCILHDTLEDNQNGKSERQKAKVLPPQLSMQLDKAPKG